MTLDAQLSQNFVWLLCRNGSDGDDDDSENDEAGAAGNR